MSVTGHIAMMREYKAEVGFAKPIGTDLVVVVGLVLATEIHRCSNINININILCPAHAQSSRLPLASPRPVQTTQSDQRPGGDAAKPRPHNRRELPPFYRVLCYVRQSVQLETLGRVHLQGTEDLLSS